MEYEIQQLCTLSGVTARTLRYYDQIGLLCPERNAENGYRIYREKQVDRLQQILFYREMRVPLEEIGKMLSLPDSDRGEALARHLKELRVRQRELNELIHNVEKTIRFLKGETGMNDAEKFEGLKSAAIAENEKKYGAEVRTRYGDAVMDRTNRKIAGMSGKIWNNQKALEGEILKKLSEAVQTGDPAGRAAQEVCRLHRQWLCAQWPDGIYTKEVHRQMGEMYLSDERFQKYYAAAGAGAAKFLKQALDIYTK